jgi:DNA polymerase-3 subunit epsilon
MRLIALDTESTGVNPRSDRLVELAALAFDPHTGTVGDTFHRYLNPERSVPPEAVEVHGLTEEFLADKPRFAQVADELFDFIGTDAAVVIHNARFDVGFLDAELARIKARAFSQRIEHIEDTLAMSRRAVRARTHTLDALCDRFGVDRSARQLHGALMDCELLAAVYPKLAAAVRSQQDRVGALLPFGFGRDLPETLEEQVEQSLALADLAALLEAERKRVNEAVRASVGDAPAHGEGWRVRFESRETTNWKAVRKDLLQGVDLSPYVKSSSAMYVERD